MKKHILVACLLLAACAATPLSRDRAAEIVADPSRSAADRTNDVRRKPVDMLSFVGVRPGMRILDISAGGGYTTELLARAVGPEGKVYAQTPKPNPRLVERMKTPAMHNVQVLARPFDDPVPPEATGLDLVTIVLNYHDISYLPVDRAQMNRRLFAALKPGGHLVVIDHSAVPGSGISAGKSLHRIDEEVVRREVQDAGFRLEAEGDFLRNPADTRQDSSNQPKVPTDKFALRFVKPG